MMEEFEKWYNSKHSSRWEIMGKPVMQISWEAWQESRKQALAEVALRDRHTRESHEEKGALVERGRIANWLDDMTEGKTNFPVTLPGRFAARWWVMRIIKGIANHLEKE